MYGVGARGCGNGLFPTYEIPKSYLSFTILVSFILVKYPDRDPDRRPSEYGTSKYLRYVPTVCTYELLRHARTRLSNESRLDRLQAPDEGTQQSTDVS